MENWYFKCFWLILLIAYKKRKRTRTKTSTNYSWTYSTIYYTYIRFENKKDKFIIHTIGPKTAISNCNAISITLMWSWPLSPEFFSICHTSANIDDWRMDLRFDCWQSLVMITKQTKKNECVECIFLLSITKKKCKQIILQFMIFQLQCSFFHWSPFSLYSMIPLSIKSGISTASHGDSCENERTAWVTTKN